MKNFLTTLVFALISINTFSQNKWSDWITTDCYAGLDYRYKYNYATATNHNWSVQFQNRYKENIHFSTMVVDISRKSEIMNSNKSTERMHAKGNGGTTGTFFFTNTPSNIYVHVTRVKFGKDSYSSDYYNCDL